MDDTQQSRTSEAAATRKRRSSILKSQRPPRTPFSELEFNVATPTETSKSRRVSFSRRTGVAEFVTNEATTTWKNFYEEQNKSLESSGNESEANAARQPIGHLGKRIFDQQFEEVEAVDFISSLNNPGMCVDTSHNVNFTHQIASLECTGEIINLPVPQSNFELSTFTDHQSKLFGDDLAIQTMGEVSDRIDINFSAVRPLDGKDDLDEIEKDLERAQSNVVCHGPFGGKDMSEYIEVDLNMTHVAMNHDQSDMSITDTVQSPKVQDVSKSFSIDKKSSIVNKDWETDKENIAINPYVTPRESANFAINEEPDKVLVFDGKRLTIQSDNDSQKSLPKDNYRQTLLPNMPPENTPQRKTIVLNVNDDLPNFVDDLHISKIEAHGNCSGESKHSNIYNDGDMSMTRPLTAKLEDIQPKRRTMLFNDNTGDISMTQALSTNIIISEKLESNVGKRRTIVFENDTGNISITQALPQSIILAGHKEISEKRRTIVFDDDLGDVSLTQAVPTNINLAEHKQELPEHRQTNDHRNDTSNIIMSDKSLVVPDKRKTIVFENDTGNVSITQAIPTNIFEAKPIKRRTIVFEDDTGNISITKPVPCNIILPEKNKSPDDRRRTIVYETEMCNISITQAIPTSLILFDGKDVNNTDEGNISFTQAIPARILLPERTDVTPKRTVVYESDSGNISIIRSDTDSNEENEKKPTSSNEIENIVFDKDHDNVSHVSMIQAISDSTMIGNGAKSSDKRRTIVYQNNTGDISITQPLPTNVLLHAPRNDIDYTDSENSMNCIHESQTKQQAVVQNHDVSMAEVVCNNENKIVTIEKKSLAFDRQSEMSFIESLPTHIENEEKLRTMYDFSLSNLSMTKPIPSNLTTVINEDVDKLKSEKLSVLSALELSGPVSQNVFVYQAAAPHSVSKMQTKRIEQGDSKAGNSSVYNIVASNASTSQPVEETKSNTPEENNEHRTSDELLVNQVLEEDRLPNADELNQQPVDIKSEDSEDVKGCSTDDLMPCKLDTEIYKTADKEKSSILDELLDMSTTSLDCATDDKNLMVKVESESSTKDAVEKGSTEKPDTENGLSDDVFYITMDSDEEAQTDQATKVETEPIPIPPKKEHKSLENSTLALDYKEDKHPKIVENLQKKLVKLKDIFSDKTKSKNRHYEQVKSPEIESNKETPAEHQVQLEEHLSIAKASESFKSANDTKELLEMLSDFTDKHTEEITNEKSPTPILVKGRMALENKSEVAEPRRLSFAPSRQSIVISREDLINNISMAQAALQQSRLDDTEVEDTPNDTTLDKYVSPQKKTVRLSDEVVKTLQFDEDDGSDVSIKSDTKTSPLKKTAFGETSYMTESKSKVIPSYLKDVSDGVKELMLDLVKPMADVLPYENTSLDKGLKKSPSMCSTQVQANLITSSQIDVSNELYSNAESAYDMNQGGSSSENTLLGGMCRALKKPIKMFRYKDMKSSEEELSSDPDVVKCGHGMFSVQDPTGPVIVFDHHNPLNNILLEPMDYSVTHRYNPQPSTETLCGSNRSQSAHDTNEKEYEVERVSTHYHIGGRISASEAKSQKTVTYSFVSSDTSKVVDQAVEAKVETKELEMKDTEVNTVIVMKGNKELLETSSSLTLVDDALIRSTFDVHIDTQSNSLEEEGVVEEPSPKKKSPVKVIYKLDDNGELKLYQQDTDVTSNDEDTRDTNRSRVKKRSYSPKREKHQHCTLSNIDMTPKPVSKVQKLSSTQFSSVVDRHKATPNKLAAERDDCDSLGKTMTAQEMSIEKARHLHEKRRSSRKSKHGPKDKKPGTTITVQQLITEYHIEATMEPEAAHLLNELKQKSDSSSAEPNTGSHSDELERSVEVVSSFASSKQARSASSETTRCSRATSGALRIDWHPELINEMSSKNLLECDSGTNVVAKIDMLPFMGSPECEWESSSGDTWMFRLLHGRLRLAIRLAHRHDNGARTCVRADTPIQSATVEPLHHDKKNTIAVLCVSFACTALRWLVCGGCVRAGEAPGLLRRAAAVARVALRWGRAMHDARDHLAYTLTDTGLLALKVANIPLRSVWEVTLRVELAGGEGEGGEVPWPRAVDVRVTRLVSDYSVPEEEVRRALHHVPNDWGHVPRTIWRIFRYLKHKKRDDELMLGL